MVFLATSSCPARPIHGIFFALNNCKLRFDFYIPSKNLLIEYDGKQHFQPSNIKGKYLVTKEEVENIKLKVEEIKKIQEKVVGIEAEKKVELEKVARLTEGEAKEELLKDIEKKYNFSHIGISIIDFLYCV